MNKSLLKPLLLGIALGVLVTLAIIFTLVPSTINGNSSVLNEQEQNTVPLYWVAPMDPNFKRDKPGKSPMGMDLVPVYAQNSNKGEAEVTPGTVTIDAITIQNLGVKTTSVKKIAPVQTLNTFATVQFAQDTILHVHPRVEGWIEELFVQAKGERVEKGKPLYTLYSPDLVNAQEEYLLALQQNNKGLVSAARSRLTSLNVPTSLITSIEKTRKVQRSVMFYAGQSGVVSELHIQQGFYVKPSTTMLVIASTGRVWVLADVPSNDLGKINLGQSARIEFDYLPASVFKAQLEYIYPTLNDNNRTGTARFVLPNPNMAIKPGMFANVLIHTEPTQANITNQILAVPFQAVIRTGKQDRVVLALGQGRFKSVAITLGNRYDDMFEVIEGLHLDDVVVTSAQFLLDSESSISSDFMRMALPSQDQEHTNDKNGENGENDEVISAWTQATVNEVILTKRQVNLSHGPLDVFNMMGMTMNFELADDIDITQFALGMEVHVEIVKSTTGMYQIKTVHFSSDMTQMRESSDCCGMSLNNAPEKMMDHNAAQHEGDHL